MRRARWIPLLLMVLIVAGVGGVYYLQKQLQQAQAPPPPPPLPARLNAAADMHCATWSEGSRPVTDICATKFEEVKDPPHTELQGVELHLYRNPPTEFDRVRSAKANYLPDKGTLYSDGDVEITRGVPVEGTPRGRLMVIRSSGVSFDARAARATTERPTQFEFDLGNGESVGATYDSTNRELRMHSQVKLNWRGRGAQPHPMQLESGELLYKESESKVYLLPWAKLTRQGMVLETAGAVVSIEDGAIRLVEAQAAKGSDQEPRRRLDYQAQNLTMWFNPDGVMEKLRGDQKARLVSTTPDGQTTVNSDILELSFAIAGKQSTLKKALASGHSEVASDPAPRKVGTTPQARLLKSDTIELEMRPGGEEIDQVRTHSPARIEFLARRKGERFRSMDAERLYVNYGAKNQIRALNAVGVSTYTEREKQPKKPAPAPARTWSKALEADFDPKTGELASLHQWEDFRYEEGERRARAHEARMNPRENHILLDGEARVWDPTGSTAARHIEMDQKTGDFSAEGDVFATRAPERKGQSSAMLSGEEQTQSKSDKMISRESGKVVTLTGRAVAWQGANRLRAKQIEIDRKGRKLAASGDVVSEFLDRAAQPSAGTAPQKSAPVYNVVTAATLHYDEASRVAHYQGGVVLRRPFMVVSSQELRAHLNESSSQSSLEKALADGGVEILQTAAGRTRRGTAEHAEYYVGEQRVLLHGGTPTLVDSLKGTTTGRRLTYFADRDRLLVDGQERTPAVSHIQRH
jgi:lipopolysaccharide export system protein LptA